MTYSRVVSVTEDAAIDTLNILCRGSALYPHLGILGLGIPFGWTNGIVMKPFLCRDTLPATPTNSPLGQVMGGPVPTKGINGHRRAKNGPKQGQGTIKTNGHKRLCLLTRPGYRTPITFPRWRHRQEAWQWTESRPPHKGKCGRTEEKPDSVAPWLDQHYLQVGLLSGLTWK